MAAIVQSGLALAREGDGTKDISKALLVSSVGVKASKFRPLLEKYCSKTLSAQNDCLEAIEDFCVDDEAMEAVCVKVVLALYDMDVVSEEAVLKWYYRKETEAVEARSKGFGARFRARMEKFIRWLEEEEDESEEEDSD